MAEQWDAYQEIRLNDIPGFMKMDPYYEERDERGEWKAPERRPVIVLHGGDYGYGGMIELGTRTRVVEMEASPIDIFRKKIGRPRREIINEPNYEEKIPHAEDPPNAFKDVYLGLADLVAVGVLTAPRTGDDQSSINSFFWYATRSMEMTDYVSLLREKGFRLEKQ